MDVSPNERTVTDRHGLEVLRPQTCWELVAGAEIGRIAFVEAGEPIILPVNHRVVDHHVVFRTAVGSKLVAAIMGKPVAFEVDGVGVGGHVGWSVLIEGNASRIFDPAEVERLETLAPARWAQARSWTDWVRISPNSISGRRLHVADDDSP